MKAAVFHRAGEPLTIEDVADPAPGPGQVVLKVCRCGVCGTDLSMTSAGDGRPLAPGSLLGHEFSGEVVELGPGVTQLKVGDLVTAQPTMGCGACPACLAGTPFWCTGAKPAGRASGFAEYTLSTQGSAVRLPHDVSLADAALTEPFACGRHGVRRAGLRGGERVLVMGAGAIGLGTAYWARRAGAAKVAVMARSDRRRAMAFAMGADSFLTTGDAPAAQAADALGGAPDVVFECAGAPGAIAAAIDCVRPRGCVTVLGYCMKPDSFVPGTALLREIDLRFAIVYDRTDFEACLDALAGADPAPRAMITGVVGFSAFPQAFEALRTSRDQCKLMLDPWAGR